MVQSSVQQKTLKKIKVFGSGNWEEVGKPQQQQGQFEYFIQIESLLGARAGRSKEICDGGTVPQNMIFSKGN